jgi:type IV secretory pathway VirB3-like protein
MQRFFEALRVQRWDDHRYYHHSRINQSLHLVSAVSFLAAYVMMFGDPAMAALIGTSTRRKSRSATIYGARSC